jgi:hypothetical protein
MKLKIGIYCTVCGKPLKWLFDASYTDKTKTEFNITPCPRCLKEAKTGGIVDGIIERDKQLEAAERKRDG